LYQCDIKKEKSTDKTKINNITQSKENFLSSITLEERISLMSYIIKHDEKNYFRDFKENTKFIYNKFNGL
jgi:hypothetical protein